MQAAELEARRRAEEEAEEEARRRKEADENDWKQFTESLRGARDGARAVISASVGIVEVQPDGSQVQKPQVRLRIHGPSGPSFFFLSLLLLFSSSLSSLLSMQMAGACTSPAQCSHAAGTRGCFSAVRRCPSAEAFGVLVMHTYMCMVFERQFCLITRKNEAHTLMYEIYTYCKLMTCT